jgi:protein-S-isoprenylcysteine O-methyltransferase Ste14
MFQEVFNQPHLFLEITIFVVLSICTLAIITSIIINFLNAKSEKEFKTEKKSIVETSTMSLFFIFFYLIIKFHIGEFTMTNTPEKLSLITLGLVIVIAGTIVNIMGRLKLGKNWANQIVIYKEQSLVTNGVFKIVRHPLYASLIWIFFGASMLYLNGLAMLSNLFIFTPFMYYRARQEEKMLTKEFPNYQEYKKKVGMFFPKLLY